MGNQQSNASASIKGEGKGEMLDEETGLGKSRVWIGAEAGYLPRETDLTSVRAHPDDGFNNWK